MVELDPSVGLDLCQEGVSLQEGFHVQTVLMRALHHQVGEGLELLYAEVLRLVVVPGLELLSEPGDSSLTGQDVQVDREVGPPRLQQVELLDGLAARVVEAGDVEEAGGQEDVGREVAQQGQAEQPADQRLASVVPQPGGSGRPRCVEDGEGVEDEAELLVGQQGVQEDEGQAGEEQEDRPPVKDWSQGQEED